MWHAFFIFWCLQGNKICLFQNHLFNPTPIFSHLTPPPLKKPWIPARCTVGFSVLWFFPTYQWQFFIGLFLYGCLHIILLLFCEGGSIKWQNFLLLRFKSSAHFCHSYHILHLYQNQSKVSEFFLFALQIIFFFSSINFHHCINFFNHSYTFMIFENVENNGETNVFHYINDYVSHNIA